MSTDEAPRASLTAPRAIEDQVPSWAVAVRATTRQDFTEAVVRLKAVNDEFFLALIEGAPTGRGRMPKEDLAAYMANVVELLNTARRYPQSSECPRSASDRLERAIESFEIARSDFERRAYEGQLKNADCQAYLKGLDVFIRQTGKILKEG